MGGLQAHTQGEVEGDLTRGVSRPTPRGVCSRGVCSRGGVSGPRGVCGDPPGWLLLQAVSILLECILVLDVNYL